MQEHLDYLDVLMFTPEIDEAAKEQLAVSSQFHYLWSFSTLRFFHLLDALLSKYDPLEKQLAVDVFPAIFRIELSFYDL